MTRRSAALGCFGLAVAVALGCASGPAEREDAIHVVQPGDTIYRLSRHYGVSVGEIVRANDIDDVSAVAVGTRLVIPGARTGAAGEASSLASLAPFGGADLREQAWREASLEFAWPIHGHFSSGFGWRGFGSHDGIDLTAPPGTRVRAAEAGRVTHSGWLGDYGRVVIVKHAGRYSTVYAHNRANKVRKGAFVEKGDLLALVGSSGNASGSHLHFEIRRDRRAENPLRYLPEAAPTAAR